MSTRNMHYPGHLLSKLMYILCVCVSTVKIYVHLHTYDTYICTLVYTVLLAIMYTHSYTYTHTQKHYIHIIHKVLVTESNTGTHLQQSAQTTGEKKRQKMLPGGFEPGHQQYTHFETPH